MKLALERDRRDRIVSAAVAAGVHLLLALLLLRGLGVELPIPQPERVELIDLAQPPPPPRTSPPPAREMARRPKPRDPEGAAAPPNLKATPTEIVAPPPPIPLPLPPPVAAAPVASSGAAPSAGAAPVPGPGTGAGGQGGGLGSGSAGTGTGGGGGGGGTPLRWLRGSIDDDDYPERAYRERATGTVGIAFTVATDGRVSDCRVTRSSGHRELDETTCRLIVRRFRYRPARDAAGQPVASVVRGQQVWEIGPEPPVREIEPERVDDD